MYFGKNIVHVISGDKNLLFCLVLITAQTQIQDRRYLPPVQNGGYSNI